jgi:hypothetical protein
MARGTERCGDQARGFEARAVGKPQNHGDLSLVDALPGVLTGRNTEILRSAQNDLNAALEDLHHVKDSVSDPDEWCGQSSSREDQRVSRTAASSAGCRLRDCLQYWLRRRRSGGDWLLWWRDLPATRMHEMNLGTSRRCGLLCSQCVVLNHPGAPHSPDPRVGIEVGSGYPTKEPWQLGDGVIWPEVSRMERWL